VKWGRLRARSLAFEVPAGARMRSAAVTLDGKKLEAKTEQKAAGVTLTASQDMVIGTGQALAVQISW